jgi:hypothetical protein
VVAALLASEWTFAKSMPLYPHWYTLRKAWTAKVPFGEVVQYIRDHGVMRNFGGATYTYFDHDSWTYWTMGASLPDTILINRAKITPAGEGSD